MQWRRDRSPTLRSRTAQDAAWLVVGALVVLSCTRTPGSLRTKETVRGRVLAATGEPLPGTDLAFRPDEPKLNDHAYATADSSGAYSVRLISGNYRVTVRPRLGFLAHTERVTVSARHPGIDFCLGGHRVSGRVIAANGTLVDSGRVFAILRAPPDAPDARALSLIERGRYSLLLPNGSYSLQAITADYWSGLYPARRDSVSIDADTVIDLRVGGISVSGRMVGPDGRPLKGAGVEVLGHPVRVRAGDDGRYQLYVPPGSYKLLFQCAYPFFMPPRTIGPLAITQPTSVDVDFSGVEWKGRVLRAGRSAPPQEITVTVKPAEDMGGRVAAIPTGPKGDFRFVVEAGHRYSLTVHDRETREQEQVVEGAAANADTTFEILLPPTTVATRADSTITLSIRAASGKLVHYIRPKKGRRPPWIEVTLRNNDPDSVTLVLPGDGSYFGRRTPLMGWDVRTSDGRRVARQVVMLCGNINPLRAGEVFTLPPGGAKAFTTAVPAYYQYEKSRRYQLRLTYENRPHLSWGGEPLGVHDPAAVQAIRNSTRCRLVSNAIEVEVR